MLPMLEVSQLTRLVSSSRYRGKKKDIQSGIFKAFSEGMKKHLVEKFHMGLYKGLNLWYLYGKDFIHGTGWWQLKDRLECSPRCVGRNDSHFDEHIFQMGWFNHQLEEDGGNQIIYVLI